nr:MAG TPA: hypothetical protein [Caudoviricetes sp.]
MSRGAANPLGADRGKASKNRRDSVRVVGTRQVV